MEDWRVDNGTAECLSTGGNRNVHLITHQMTKPAGTLAMSVRAQGIETEGRKGGFGFRIGARSDINEYRSNSFSHNGINCGLHNGKLVIGGKRKPVAYDADSEITLSLSGKPADEKYELTITASTATGDLIGQLTDSVDAESILGNIALVNNIKAKLDNRQGSRFRFREWKVSGTAVTVTESSKIRTDSMVNVFAKRLAQRLKAL